MPRNSLLDLKNHLFGQVERLAQDNFDERTMNVEAKRANALVNVATAIIKIEEALIEPQKK